MHAGSGGVTLRRRRHDQARFVDGGELVDRRVHADRVEVEQLDTGETADARVDVAGHPQIDDELLSGAVGARRAVVFGGEDGAIGCRRACDDDGRLGRFAGEVGGVDRDEMFTLREPRAARPRVDADVTRADGTEGREGCRGIPARPDEQHPGILPLTDPRSRQLDCKAHERAARFAEPRGVLDGARGLGRALEQLLERRGRHALAVRGVERAPHLTGDLVLADGDRVQARRDGEQVLGDARSVREVDRVAHVPVGQRGEICEAFHDGIHRRDRRGIRCIGDVEVRLEAVAGGEDDGPADRLVRRRELGRGGVADHRQSLEVFERCRALVGGEADEHGGGGSFGS